MSGVPFTSIVQHLDRSWTFSWAAVPGAPYYRIVLYGQEVDRVDGTTYNSELSGYNQFPPEYEVVAGDSPALSEQYQPFLVVQWYGENCEQYFVEEFTGGSWVVRRQVPEDGSPVYSVTTPVLTDGNTYRYGVQALAGGVKSLVQEFKITMVCPPRGDDGVKISYSNSTQELVIGG